MNKSEFLKEQALKIHNDILNKAVLSDPSKLLTFSVLSFSDLKKYKFYYWINFPQLHSNWQVLSSSTDITYESLFSSNGSDLQQFFIIKDDITAIPLSSLEKFPPSEQLTVGFFDTASIEDRPSWEARNLLTLLSIYGYKDVKLVTNKHNGHNNCFTLRCDDSITELPKVTGWERTSSGKLGPKLADLGSLIDPVQLADQAVDLNLKLMKWRISPEINLETIKNTKCLLLGAGTLGSYVARALLGWGCNSITLVDNGKVSFSNPVRQPLFKFEDCLDGGAPKAETAAKALKEIYPSVNAKGFDLEVPMAGHPITNESRQLKDFETLVSLIEDHDVVFLLMDSRETRWLPTVIANALGKIVINTALGFDSYLVMRHGCVKDLAEDGPRLGCYFCNDVVAPSDSLTDRTLDQMCTVTRPGVALIASGLAVELLVSILQHPEKQYAPASTDSKDENATILGVVPHQIRGFLHNFNNIKLEAPNYQYCSACSKPVIEGYINGGWEFVKAVLNDSKYLEELTGLAELQRKTEEIDLDFDITDDENEFI